ncbi:hypothetical protein K466DRAFT_439619, partial [Polyporus arcularius HHB13444]
YLDNVLTPAEADILCGVCRVYGQQRNQCEDLSWWPKPTTWASSGMYTGIWNPWNEDWFQKRLSGIRDGTAQPMNASSWRS